MAKVNATEAHWVALNESRRQYGLLRFEMGLHLLAVKEGNLWEGKAESFSRYLEQLHINDSGARQYMRVANKFFLELKISEDMRAELALVGMSQLDRAAKMITKDNQVDVVFALLTLSPRDCDLFLKEMATLERGEEFNHSSDVTKAISNFRQLADDQRIEFLARIGYTTRKPATTEIQLTTNSTTRHLS
jgi:hypothetical protein